MELKDIYGHFLEYYRILSTIKNTFRQLFGPNLDIFRINNPFIPFHLSLNLKDKRGCKSLCYLLAAFKEPKSIIRWESKLNVYFSRDDWKVFYLIPFNCTMDTKLRWLQYRILNRFLTRNSFMCKIGQIDRVHFLKKSLDNEVRCKCGKKRYLWLFQSIWVCWIQKWWIPKIIFTSWPSYLHKNKMAAKIINLGQIVSKMPIISQI